MGIVGANSSTSQATRSHWINGSLCSLAIALWGWQTGLWFLALPMALVLEARHVVRQRWPLSWADLQSIAKLCGLILAILTVVLLSLERSQFIYSLFQWLPVAAFPLVAAQTYGDGVLAQLRDGFANPRLRALGIRRKRNPVNLQYLYFFCCILAASAVDGEGYLFYGLAVGAIAVFLWQLRPRRSTPILWVLLMALSTGLGFVGQAQITQFQDRLEDQVVAALSELVGGAVDPERNSTRMGTVGKLKLSSRIAFRVSSESVSAASDAEATKEGAAPLFPLLLREATYNQYRLSNWIAESSEFLPINPGTVPGAEAGIEPGSWQLQPASSGSAAPQSTLTIATNLRQGKGVLTLPAGTTQLRQLPVETVQRNQYGTVRVDPLSTVAYEALFNPSQSDPSLALPIETDFQIPKADEAAIAQVLQSLGLDESGREGQSDRAIANQIAAYFQTFDYSLDLIRSDADGAATTPLADFLLNTQAGHCEYFASATTLLLRGVGIPARYAVGYSVHEFSPLERQYIVRSRDAHAWTLAYIDGRWQTLDTTPPDWTVQEREMASPLQVISDLFAFLTFQVGVWVRQFQQLGPKGVLVIALPLLGYLLVRSLLEFRGRSRGVTAQDQSEAAVLQVQAGLDSEFYQIELLLAERGMQRSPSESLMQWQLRLRNQLNPEQWQALCPILNLHYRHRFDPQGLSDGDRQQLAALSQAWLQQSRQTAIEISVGQQPEQPH